MRLRMLFGALALCAALFCTFDVTPASAQSVTAAQATSAASAGGLYVYPGHFPCVNGPGFCRRIIIIIIRNYSGIPNQDYRVAGNVQMGISEKQGVGYIADITGADVPDSRLLQKGEIAIPTVSYDQPPQDLE